MSKSNVNNFIHNLNFGQCDFVQRFSKEMDVLLTNNYCRICIQPEVELSNINQAYIAFNDEKIAILDVLNSFSDIKVGGNFPETICSDCISKASTAYEFKTKCDRSNDFFKNVTKEENEEVFEIFVKEEVSLSDNDIDESETTEQVEEVKIEQPDTNEDSFLEPEEILSCTECKTVFKSKVSWRVHMARHKNEGKFVCDVCGKRFNSNTYLQRHSLTHISVENRKFECDICHKKFSLGSLLNKHKRHVHANLRNHLCPTCGKSYNYRENLKTHMLTHANKKLFHCEICGKGVMDIHTHMKVHTGIKPHACKQCGKAFMFQNHLKLHENSHAGIKPYSCEICHKNFSQRKNLKYHLTLHQEERKRTHLCTVCGKKYFTSNQLRRHVRNHELNLSLPCQHCDEVFETKFERRKHEFTHTKVDKHVCEICLKEFCEKKVLRDHMMLHTGERPYVCNVCGKGFIKKDKCKYHMQNKHGSDEFCSVNVKEESQEEVKEEEEATC